jgi:hypothetical protein
VILYSVAHEQEAGLSLTPIERESPGRTGAGIRVLRTAVRAPLMNSVCERFLASVRRECLDHLIIRSKLHLRHVLAEYALSYSTRHGLTRGSASGFRSPLNTCNPSSPARSVRFLCSAGFIMITASRREGDGRQKEPAQPGASDPAQPCPRRAASSRLHFAGDSCDNWPR